jgi:hypothetical protein
MIAIKIKRRSRCVYKYFQVQNLNFSLSLLMDCIIISYMNILTGQLRFKNKLNQTMMSKNKDAENMNNAFIIQNYD